MYLQSIKCGWELPDGTKCEELAHVIGTEFIYSEEFAEGRFEQVLDEVHYTIECPTCGRWTWLEAMHSNRTFSTVEGLCDAPK